MEQFENKIPWHANTYAFIKSERRTIHHLKCEANAFVAVLEGIKSAEFRKNDRRFKIGDILKLYKLNSKGVVEEYSPTLFASITHVQRDHLPLDFVMLSITTDVVVTSELEK